MAKWFQFNTNWDDMPQPRVMHAYSEGSTVFIPEDVVERAKLAGVGVVVQKPKGATVDKAGKTSYAVEFKG